jgi:precorrin-3B synthase
VTVRDAAAGRALLDGAEAMGLIVRDDDPVLRIEACPGAPDCTSSSVDARGDARRMASLAVAKSFTGSIHVSGCAKGCARSAPSDLVLVGNVGRYQVIRHATTRGPAERLVDADDLASVFLETPHG